MPEYHHDAFGHLQPADLHQVEASDFHRDFVDTFPESKTRGELFSGWKSYCADFSKEVTPTFTQWIAGSFVTKKQNPSDIDVVNFVPASRYTAAINRFDVGYGSKQTWGVDGRTVPVYPEENPMYELTRRHMAHWLNLFGQDRQGRRKGLLVMEQNHGNP